MSDFGGDFGDLGGIVEDTLNFVGDSVSGIFGGGHHARAAADAFTNAGFDRATFHGFTKAGVVEGFFSGESAALRNLFAHLGRATVENIIELAELNFTQEFIKKCFGHSHDISKEELGAAAKAMQAHSLIGDKLRELVPDSPAAREYLALGMNPPSEEVLKNAYNALLRKLHPDLHNGKDVGIEAVKEAFSLLGDSHNTEPYREILQKAEFDPSLKTRLKDFFEEFAGKQTAFYNEASKASRLQIGYTAKAREDMGKAERIWHDTSSSFKNASPTKQGAIIFATVTGTTLLAYGIAKHIEHKKQAKSHVEALEKEKPQASLSV